MKRLTKRCLIILTSILLLFSFYCYSGTMLITKLNQGETIKVPVKQDFTIKLKANPSTGYDWEILNINKEIIQLKDKSFVIKDSIPGSSGFDFFTFTSLKKGQSLLKLGQLRSWEGPGSIVDSFSIIVKVQ